jgi:hypothetical protein
MHCLFCIAQSFWYLIILIRYSFDTALTLQVLELIIYKRCEEPKFQGQLHYPLSPLTLNRSPAVPVALHIDLTDFCGAEPPCCLRCFDAPLSARYESNRYSFLAPVVHNPSRLGAQAEHCYLFFLLLLYLYHWIQFSIRMSHFSMLVDFGLISLYSSALSFSQLPPQLYPDVPWKEAPA